MCDLGVELYNEGIKGRHLVRHTLISRKQETESSEAVPGSPADRGQEVLTSEGWATIAWGKAKAPGLSNLLRNHGGTNMILDRLQNTQASGKMRSSPGVH